MRLAEPMDGAGLFRICFVCTGNICRSPIAEIVFDAMLRDAGLDSEVGVLSAGTGRWHVGAGADERAVAALRARGYDDTEHRARQFEADWFGDLELIVTLDRSHTRKLRALAPGEPERERIRSLLSWEPELTTLVDVPDPYYSDQAAFDRVLTLIEQASVPLLADVRTRLGDPTGGSSFAAPVHSG